MKPRQLKDITTEDYSYNKKRHQTSSLCVEDLESEGCLSGYSSWSTKTEGKCEGAILIGQHKDGRDKRKYIKKCDSDDAHTEMLVFELAKRVGITVPEVKFNRTQKSLYLFSSDLTQATKTFANQCFVNIRDAYIEFHSQDGKFYPRGRLIRREEENKQIVVNKQSVAKLAVFTLLTGIGDLNFTNIGVVYDSSLDEPEATIAMIDFNLQSWTLSFHPLNSTRVKFISFNNLMMDQPWSYLKAFVDLTESDYCLAYSELKNSMNSACDESLAHVINSKLFSEKKIEECKNWANTWKKMLLTLNMIIDDAEDVIKPTILKCW